MNPVIAEILRQGRRRRTPLVLAALATGRVETNFTNMRGGDADSSNWRQERESGYGDKWARTGGPLNLRASVRRFYQEARQLYHGQSPGELAADVQRPAAQYRGRYADVMGEARSILNNSGRLPGVAGRSTSATPQLVDTFNNKGYQQARRQQIVAQYLQKSGAGSSILFKSGLLSGAEVDPADYQGQKLMPGMRRGGPPRQQAAPAGAVQQAILEAQQRLGIKEVGTTNTGRRVDKMEARFGFHGAPWCGIFAGTVLQEAGVRGVTSRIASVAAIEDDARRHRGPFAGFTSTGNARAGDLLITRKGGHVAFIERVDRNGTIHVIGGNQTGGVTRATYRPGSAYGVARVRYRR